MLERFGAVWKKMAELAERYGEYPFYGFIFFMAVGNAGAEIFSVLLMLCFLLRKSLKPDLQFLRNRAHGFLALFFVFSALSLVNSGPLLGKSLIALFLKWGKFCALFLVTEDFVRSERSLNRCVIALLLVAGILGVDVLFQILGGRDLFYQRPSVPIFHNERLVFKAATATFGHGNDLGAYLVPLSLIATSLSFDKSSNPKRWGFILLAVLLGASLAMTFSRGAWLGFFFGFMLMLVLSRRYKASILFFFIVLIALFLFPDMRERIAYTLRPEGDSLRWPVWDASWDLIREHPFVGNGIGTFVEQCNRLLSQRFTYAHNCYLQIWAETGVLSLLAFLLFLGTVILRGIKAYLADPDPVLLGLLSGVLGFLVHSFFDTQFYALRLAYLLWFLLGLLVAATRLKQGSRAA